MSTASVGTISDYNMLFMTHLASVVGTGLTCIGFPLMSPVVLSCTFNLLAAVSSLLLSILVGWDTLMADGVSTSSSTSLLMQQTLFLAPNNTAILQHKLPFMEEVTLISTLLDRAMLADQPVEVQSSKWISYDTSFQNGLQFIQNSIVSPIYYNELGYRCLTVNMGRMTANGAMAGWKQEICLSPIGRNTLLSLWGREIQLENKILQWLDSNGLPISQLSVLRGSHWSLFYREWSLPVMKALLVQTKGLLRGEKNNSWSITDGNNTMLTSRFWRKSS